MVNQTKKSKTFLAMSFLNLSKIRKKEDTGRGLLGAPTVWAASFSPEKHQKPETGKPNKEVPETDKTPWKMWLDTSLFLPSHRCYHERYLWFLRYTN